MLYGIHNINIQDTMSKNIKRSSGITETPVMKELTPEITEKIFKSIRRMRYDNAVSKREVLHHLKQVKAHMGKLKAQHKESEVAVNAIVSCMAIIDKKIQKIIEL